MAAIECYKPKRKIMILERMPRPALKLRMSGKGRCNITNDAELSDFIQHFGKNGRFLKFAFSEFFRPELLNYFAKLGVSFKLERGGRYFPQNDKAMDIVNALLNILKERQIPISLNSQVIEINHNTNDSRFNILTQINNDQQIFETEKVVIATGGKSYPKTGSNGSGYKLATKLGHKVTPDSPSLVPIDTRGKTAGKLEGLSLRNVRATVWCNNKKLDERFGEMLFTGTGVSGPIILSLSKGIIALLAEKHNISISIDLKPALEHKILDQRLIREISNHSRQNFSSLLKKLLPKKMIPVFIKKLNIPENKQLSSISAGERKRLRLLLKDFSLEVSGHRSYDEAIVTAGGVSISEITPSTMESKLIKNLYFAGEVIDIDGDTGGFNLQAAFSTGWIAGKSL